MCQEKNGLSGRNLVGVFDFGFWKNQDFVIFISTLNLRLRALILTWIPAQKSKDYQLKPKKSSASKMPILNRYLKIKKMSKTINNVML
jgi:hypothetical protein